MSPLERKHQAWSFFCFSWPDLELGRNNGKEVQDLGVAFTKDRRRDEELDLRIGKARAVNASFALFGCHETRNVKKVKALIFQNSFCSHSHLLS